MRDRQLSAVEFNPIIAWGIEPPPTRGRWRALSEPRICSPTIDAPPTQGWWRLPFSAALLNADQWITLIQQGNRNQNFNPQNGREYHPEDSRIGFQLTIFLRQPETVEIRRSRV